MRLGLIIFFILFFINFSSKADVINNVKISGNSRVSEETILDIVNIEKGKKYTNQEINNLQKKLFESNFFKSLSFDKNINSLEINVVENPLINFFYINGTSNKTREEFIYDNILLSQNKIFSENILNKDLFQIKKIYESDGYFDIEVTPQITLLDDNVINLILDIKRGKKHKIKNIFFVGDKYFRSSDLIDIVSSGKENWWKFFSDNSTVNQDRLNYDESLLKNFYLNNGFYDVQILGKEIKLNNNKEATITFSINSGKKYLIKNINIDNTNNILNLNELKKVNEFVNELNNSSYSKEKIFKIEKKINDFLKLKKIEFVTVKSFLKKDNSNNLSIDFKTISNSKEYVNNIVVAGNSITNEDVIRRQLLFFEGDAFTQYKKDESLRKLKNTGIFRNVKIKKINKDAELVDIYINVEEQPTGSISAGLGIGNTGANVSAGINEQNLFGQGIKTNTNLSVGTEKISGNVSLNIPDYNNSDNNLIYNAYIIDTDYDNAGYESKVIGNSIATSFNIYEDVLFRPGFGFDIDDINTNSNASELYKSRAGSYLTLKGSYKFEKDKRDNQFQTRDGYLMSFSQTIGLPGSDIPYIENNIYSTKYFPLNKDFIVNVRAGANSINSISDKKDVKLSDRKFLSSKNLRGFENFGVGPKDGNDHIGGNYSAHTNLSSTFPNPLPENWQANSVAFIDIGNVWGVDFDDTKDSSKLRSSIGVSLEWFSPLGPLSFTLSETLSSSPGDIEESFSFRIGSIF